MFRVCVDTIAWIMKPRTDGHDTLVVSALYVCYTSRGGGGEGRGVPPAFICPLYIPLMMSVQVPTTCSFSAPEGTRGEVRLVRTACGPSRPWRKGVLFSWRSPWNRSESFGAHTHACLPAVHGSSSGCLFLY